MSERVVYETDGGYVVTAKTGGERFATFLCDFVDKHAAAQTILTCLPELLATELHKKFGGDWSAFCQHSNVTAASPWGHDQTFVSITKGEETFWIIRSHAPVDLIFREYKRGATETRCRQNITDEQYEFIKGLYENAEETDAKKFTICMSEGLGAKFGGQWCCFICHEYYMALHTGIVCLVLYNGAYFLVSVK
jgi:hypothetical protein